MNNEPIVVEAVYDATPETVWKAITHLPEMRQWFFPEIKDFQPEVGFETRFDVQCEGEVYPHLWKVAKVKRPTEIVYDWRYGGFPGTSTVTWDLQKTDDGTTLKLTHRIIEPFPKDNPIFSRESGLAGWTYFIQNSLKNFLIEAGVE